MKISLVVSVLVMLVFSAAADAGGGGGRGMGGGGAGGGLMPYDREDVRRVARAGSAEQRAADESAERKAKLTQAEAERRPEILAAQSGPR